VRMCVTRWPLFGAANMEDPVVHRQRMAITAAKIWKGKTSELCVRFLHGDAALQAKVLEIANAWQPYTGIPFVPWTSGRHHILVDFRAAGHWSLLGTDSLQSGFPGGQSMNLQFPTQLARVDQKELQRVALHEFGHALGAVHEHQSPTRQIPWIRARVYAWYFANTDFRDRATVDQQVLNACSEPQLRATAWDAHSIMEYPIDPYLVEDSFREQALATQHNDTLSELDKTWMSTIYEVTVPSPTVPLPTTPTTIPHPVAPPVSNGEIDIPLIVDGPSVPAIVSAGEQLHFMFTIAAAGPYTLCSSGSTRLAAALYGPGDRAQFRVMAQDADSPDIFNFRITSFLPAGNYWLTVQHTHPRGRGEFAVRLATGDSNQ